ncbi:MAG: hypothetical protein ACRDBX_03795 [Erysipelotrichaceae bacterium]
MRQRHYELYPIYLFAGITLFTVYIVPMSFDFSFVDWFPATYSTYDFYNFHKAFLIWISAVWAIGAKVYQVKVKQHRLRFHYSYVLVALFLGLVLLSAIQSDPLLHDFVWFGYFSRFEGTLTWLAYGVMYWYILDTVRDVAAVRKIMVFMWMSLLVCCLVGVTQFVGRDLLMQPWFKYVVSPPWVWERLPNFQSHIGGNLIYGTLAQPNYISFYCGALLPLLTYQVLIVEKKKVVPMILFWSLVLFTLLGSKSISGLVAYVITLATASLFLFPLWSKRLVRLAMMFGIGVALLLQNRVWIGNDLDPFFDSEEVVNTSMNDLDGVRLVPEGLWFEMDAQHVLLVYNETTKEMSFFDETGALLPYTQVGQRVELGEPYEAFRFEYFSPISFGFNISGRNVEMIVDDGTYMLYNLQGRANPIVEVEKWGFARSQSFGSGRGYIWSVSLPLLRDCLWLGKGAETYAFYVPQNDVLGKIPGLAYEVFIHVDKPHSMYIQLVHAFGLPALLLWLMLFGLFHYENRLRFGATSPFDSAKGWAYGIGYSLFAFLIGATMNDLSVQLTPLAIVLLACGFAIHRATVKEGTM